MMQLTVSKASATTKGSKLVTSMRRTVKQASNTTYVPAANDALAEWYGPTRKTYLPGVSVPEYLDGTMPGDHGYDPLQVGVGQDMELFRTGELMNGRFAMLGAAGMLIPEILETNGAPIKGGNWLETGSLMLNGGTLDYASPFGVWHNPLDLTTVLVVNGFLIACVEYYRLSGKGPAGFAPGIGGFDSTIFESMNRDYPGGPFDPLNLTADPEKFEILKVNEIRNGRLAMMGFLGFAVQGYYTHEGPYANLLKHIADPNGYNILTVLGGK